MDQIISDIYEAGLLPEKWSGLLESLAAKTGCHGGSLFFVDGPALMWAASRNCEDHLDALLSDGWSARNIRAQRLVARSPIEFLTEHDLCSPAEIADHPIYTDFLRPRGLGWTAATVVVGAQGRRAILSIDRAYADGPVPPETIDCLNTIRPHLARAAFLSEQIGLERAAGALTGLEVLSIPAVALGPNGRIRCANRLFAGIADIASEGAFGALTLKGEPFNARLKTALAGLGRSPAPLSVPLVSDDGYPVVLHITPVEKAGRDLFSSVEAIAAFVPLSAPGLPFRSLVQHLYDFTRAEAEVAEMLLGGASVKEIALRKKVSIETTRSHLKRLMAKACCTRQSELIARFSNVRRH